MWSFRCWGPRLAPSVSAVARYTDGSGRWQAGRWYLGRSGHGRLRQVGGYLRRWRGHFSFSHHPTTRIAFLFLASSDLRPWAEKVFFFSSFLPLALLRLSLFHTLNKHSEYPRSLNPQSWATSSPSTPPEWPSPPCRRLSSLATLRSFV